MSEDGLHTHDSKTQVPSPAIDVKQEPMPTDPDLVLSLQDFWQLVWTRKWFVLLTTLAFVSLGATYSVLATPWYRSEVLLLPHEKDSGVGMLAQFGGLADLAGIRLATGDKEEPLALLESRDFARDFIERNGLLTVILSKRWDADKKQWKTRKITDGRVPDIRDAVEYFDKKVRTVTTDRKTGLVTLSVNWTDPQLAAAWANALARQLNDSMREHALEEAKANVAYLQRELANTTIISMQQTIGRLLETELQKLMLARGNDEFSFRVIDSAQVPIRRFKPRRVLVILASSVAGLFAAVFWVIVRHQWRAVSMKR